MNESTLQPTPAMADQEQAVYPPTRVVLDGRRPKLLDHRGHALQVTAGYVDVFAVSMIEGSTIGARHHLFRVEGGEILLDLEQSADGTGSRIEVIAVGGPGAEARMLPRLEIRSPDLVATWITRLAGLIAGPSPGWEMRELAHEGATEISPGERCRGPGRGIVWVALQAGTAKLMALAPVLAVGGPPLPLTSGMWLEAGQSACTAVASAGMPDAKVLWHAIDQLHDCATVCIRNHLARDVARETERLVRRSELTTAQTFESFDRLSAIVVRRSGRVEREADLSDPLLAACRLVVEAGGVPFIA